MSIKLAKKLLFMVLFCLSVPTLYAQTPTVPEFTEDQPEGWNRLLYATYAPTTPGVMVTASVGIDNQGRVFTSTVNLLDQCWLSVFGTDGNYVESWDGGASGTAGRIKSPTYGIKADINNNMYVDLVDTVDNKIYIHKYDQNGLFIDRFEYNFYSGGIAISNTMGKIILNDDDDTTIHIYNLNGTFDRKIKRPGMAANERFEFGVNMIYDEGVGRFYFRQQTNPRSLLMYDEDFNILRQITGTYVDAFMSATTGGFDVHPQTHDLWLQIGNNQNYFIIDTLGILKGRFVDASLATTNSCKRFRFDKQGNIYTASDCQQLIYRYSPKLATGIIKASGSDGALIAYPSPNSGSFRIQSPLPLSFHYAELIAPDGKTERHESMDIETQMKGLLMVHIFYKNGSRYHAKVLVE